MQELLKFVNRSAVDHLAVECSYIFEKDDIVINEEIVVSDLPSIKPDYLMLVTSGELSTSFKISLTLDMIPAVDELLALPLPFIAYNAKMFLFCLWRLGLAEPETIWDCYIFEKAR
ncbi:hypothetical protein KAI46_12835, partial [bacterium]|nr:hypothetical protein [bacterium]